jgi:hypothetical protein
MRSPSGRKQGGRLVLIPRLLAASIEQKFTPEFWPLQEKLMEVI